MAALNPLTREVVFKIVFYGPGLGGKTTTLEFVHAATKPEHRGKMVSLATSTDRTLYFDYLPIRVPRMRGMSVRLQLYTVPGQVHYAATRKLVLSGADGIVFVADSQAGRVDDNHESLEDLTHNLAEHDRRLEDVPHSFHWNKRDLSDLLSVEELERRFNPRGVPSIETVATHGDGVFQGLERIIRLVLRAYESELPRTSQMPGLSSEVGLEEAIRDLVESPRDVSRSSVVEEATSPPPPNVEPVRSPSAPPSSGAGASVAEAQVFSVAAVWPESERETVRKAEARLASADAAGAVLACDLLLARALASASSLAGTSDAPRDPNVAALLLGLDGARYLAFRARVRAARRKESVSMRDAWECFALALDARLARGRLAAG
jgi:mutual gliding-motility protein MglA